MVVTVNPYVTVIGAVVLFVNAVSPMLPVTGDTGNAVNVPPVTAPYVTLVNSIVAPAVVLDTLIDGVDPLQIVAVVFVIVKFGFGFTVTFSVVIAPIQPPTIGLKLYVTVTGVIVYLMIAPYYTF